MLLILMGSLDCLTTVVGSLYFGARELNPLIVGLVNSNLPAFVVIKLVVTVCMGAIFGLRRKKPLAHANSNGLAFKIAYNMLRASYVFIVLFLVFVVANKIVVIVNASL
jgi:Domain of unknown function (DUF5658)